MVNSSAFLCGSASMLLYAKLGGILYDKMGPRAPFLVMSGCDGVFAFGIILLYVTGKMTH